MRLPVLHGTHIQVECELDKDSHAPLPGLAFLILFVARASSLESHTLMFSHQRLIQEQQVGCGCCHSGASGARGWLGNLFVSTLVGDDCVVVSDNCLLVAI